MEGKVVLKIRKNTKIMALILALFLLLMNVDLVLLSAEEGKEEYRSCAEALKECMGDNLILLILNPRKVIYCVAGWVFCKKYVEDHLPKK
jgi:hypothetical protein